MTDIRTQLRDAFIAGFQCCRNYGDNHAHFDGEQKEQRIARYLDSLVIDPQPSRQDEPSWDEIVAEAKRYLAGEPLPGTTKPLYDALRKIIVFVEGQSPPVPLTEGDTVSVLVPAPELPHADCERCGRMPCMCGKCPITKTYCERDCAPFDCQRWP
jgi:hypothetical protein